MPRRPAIISIYEAKRPCNQAARIGREKLERNLLLEWSREYGTRWRLDRGRWRAQIGHSRNAVGLVKSFNYQYRDRETRPRHSSSLPPEHRTSAFAAANRWRHDRERRRSQSKSSHPMSGYSGISDSGMHPVTTLVTHWCELRQRPISGNQKRSTSSLPGCSPSVLPERPRTRGGTPCSTQFTCSKRCSSAVLTPQRAPGPALASANRALKEHR